MQPDQNPQNEPTQNASNGAAMPEMTVLPPGASTASATDAVPAAATTAAENVASSAANGEAAMPAAAPGNHPKRILLVEDDDALASVYITRLQAEGFDVQRCANGEEALDAARTYQPDLVLLDVMMPKVSGFDVLDILRNTPETANLKVIMLTALSQDSDQERAKTLGADDYLVKSQVVISDVIDRIRQHLAAN